MLDPLQHSGDECHIATAAYLSPTPQAHTGLSARSNDQRSSGHLADPNPSQLHILLYYLQYIQGSGMSSLLWGEGGAWEKQGKKGDFSIVNKGIIFKICCVKNRNNHKSINNCRISRSTMSTDCMILNKSPASLSPGQAPLQNGRRVWSSAGGLQ